MQLRPIGTSNLKIYSAKAIRMYRWWNLDMHIKSFFVKEVDIILISNHKPISNEFCFHSCFSDSISKMVIISGIMANFSISRFRRRYNFSWNRLCSYYRKEKTWLKFMCFDFAEIKQLSFHMSMSDTPSILARET